MRKPLRKAIFPVGGLGTRFLPATKAMPKEMLPVVDKPLIQYAVEEARAAGIEELIFVTGRGKGAIEDHFDYSYELQETLKERNKDTELALIDNLIQSDIPCLKQMVEIYNEVGGNVVAVMDVPREHTDRYGVLKTGKQSGR